MGLKYFPKLGIKPILALIFLVVLLTFIPKQALADTNDPAKLDITFIGDKYPSWSGTFYDDRDRIINEGLKVVEPFASRQSQIVYHTVDDAYDHGLCDIRNTGTCNWNKVRDAVNRSGYPYDKIVVIVNWPYSVFGQAEPNSNVVAIGNDPTLHWGAVHELGHSVGQLVDERLNFQEPARSDRNCYIGWPPNPNWPQDIVPSNSYYWFCGMPWHFRSSGNSIMNTGDDGTDTEFNAISKKYLNEEMDKFTTANSPQSLPECVPGAYKTTCAPATCGGGNWCTSEVWQCRSDGLGWDYRYPECSFDYRCGDCSDKAPVPTPPSCGETWGQCGSCSGCMGGHPEQCVYHKKTDCQEECLWDPTGCSQPTPTPTPTPIPCQTITSYGSPNPVLARGTITFTFTSNGAYTNVGIQPGDSTTCGGVTVSTNGFGLGTGSKGWRWTCTAGSAGGNFNATFTNSQNCPATKAYTITVPTTGLKGTYYKDLTFTTIGKTIAGEAVNFNWGANSPYPGIIPANNFAVRWTGYIKPPSAGNYTFYTATDDGVRLYINGKLYIDKWIHQNATEYSTIAIGLTNTKIPIRMDYFEGTGNALSQLKWSGPNIAKQIIPQSYLSPL